MNPRFTKKPLCATCKNGCKCVCGGYACEIDYHCHYFVQVCDNYEPL